jgi:hypothetical protein
MSMKYEYTTRSVAWRKRGCTQQAVSRLDSTLHPQASHKVFAYACYGPLVKPWTPTSQCRDSRGREGAKAHWEQLALEHVSRAPHSLTRSFSQSGERTWGVNLVRDDEDGLLVALELMHERVDACDEVEVAFAARVPVVVGVRMG